MEDLDRNDARQKRKEKHGYTYENRQELMIDSSYKEHPSPAKKWFTDYRHLSRHFS